jgi:predicted transcriptional regulator
MKRGRFEIAAEILREVIRTPNFAPTRLIAKTGVAYKFLNPLVSEGFLEFENMGKKRRRLRVTDKGRLFLKLYQPLEELFPLFQDKT